MNDKRYVRVADAGNLKEISEGEFAKMLISNAPMCFFVVDIDRNLVYVNDHFKEIAGAGDEELLGRRCYEVCGHQQPCPKCRLDMCFMTGTEQSLRGDDTRKIDIRYSDCHIIPVDSEESGQAGQLFLEIIFDRTEEHDLRMNVENDFEKTYKMLLYVLSLQEEDIYTHSEMVRDQAVAIADRMGLSTTSTENLERAAMLHDIGKISMFQDKMGGILAAEPELVFEYAIRGYNILTKIHRFETVAKIIHALHENYDGSGFPYGVSEEAIPIESSILRVANFIVSKCRSTAKDAHPDRLKEAVRHIVERRGTAYHPDVVEAFLSTI